MSKETKEDLIRIVCPHCKQWFYEMESEKARPKICPFCKKEVFNLVGIGDEINK